MNQHSGVTSCIQEEMVTMFKPVMEMTGKEMLEEFLGHLAAVIQVKTISRTTKKLWIVSST